MADRTVTLNIGANIADLTAKLRKASNDVKDFSGKLDQKIQKNRVSWDQMSNGMGIAGLAGVAAFAMIVKGAADFDKSMSKVKASGADAAANIRDLRAAAIKAGADTQYSADEAADAITDLAKAGVSAKEIMGGGLSGALSLAAAGEMDVKQAAEVTATALAQFKLEGSQASHVADLLAAGAGKAMGEVSDMGTALAQGGLVAHQTGLSLEETTGALAAFAQQGLIGSDAGTSLKTMLQRLTPQGAVAQAQFDDLGISAYDAGGQFVGLAAFAGQLSDKMGKMTPQARNAALAVMFGSDAVRGASVLYEEGARGMQKWITAVDDQGFAARQAATLTDNLAGDLERLGGSIDTVFIQSGTGASDSMRGLAQAAGVAVNAFGQLPGPVLSAMGMLTGAGGLGLLGAAGVMKLAGAVSTAHDAFKNLNITAGKAKFAIGAVGGALAVGTIALSLWLGAQAAAKADAEDFASTLVVVGDKVLTTAATLTEMNSKLVETKTLMGFGPTLMDLMDTIGVSATDAQGYLNGEAEAVANVQAAMDDYVRANPLAGSTPVTMLTQGLDGLKGSLTAAERTTLQKSRADKEAANSATEHADATSTMNAYLTGEVDQLGKATTSLKDYEAALWKAADAQLAISGGEIGFRQAAADAMKGINAKDSKGKFTRKGKGVDTHTQAGRDNQGDLNKITTSGKIMVNSLLEQYGAGKKASDAMQEVRDRYIAAATAATGSKDEAIAMADALMLIPKSVTPKIKPSLDDAAMKEWDKYHPGTKRPTINPKLARDTYTIYFNTKRQGGPKLADGGLFAREGGSLVQRFADGGFPSIGSQQPQIQPNHGPAGIQWAETGAGPWEAFISGNPAKAERSRAIATDVVDRLGGAVQFAAGGVFSTPQIQAMQMSSPSAGSIAARPVVVPSPTFNNYGPDPAEMAARNAAQWQHMMSGMAVQS